MTPPIAPVTAPPPSAPRRSDESVTYREAADLTGFSMDTIERDRQNGRYPHAVQDSTPQRMWRIPVADLVAAGRLDADRVALVEQELAASRESRAQRQLREELIRTKEQLRAAQATAEAQQATIDHQQRLLELLAARAA